MDKERAKHIARDVASGTLIGASGVLLAEEMLHPSNKLSVIARNTSIGGFVGSAIGLFLGLIHHRKNTNKTERLAQEKVVSDVNKDAARTL